nr:hypothetical protein [Nanoarchaeum sp.]
MTYLLDKTLVLDDFCDWDNCLVFNTWATISEVNTVLQRIYGLPVNIIKKRKYNSEVYGINGSEVRYIQGRKLNVLITPIDKESKNRLEESLIQL